MIEDREKIERLRGGEDATFHSIYFKYYEMFYHLAFQFLGNESETKEILQDVFLKLWEIKAQLKADSTIHNYLFTLVKNNCLNLIKRKQLVLRHNENIRWIELQYQQESLTRLQYENIEVEELNKKINRAIENLPEHCNRVFCMSRFENLRNKEIAEQLNVTIKTVEAHLTKALKILRSELKDYLPTIATTIHILF